MADQNPLDINWNMGTESPTVAAKKAAVQDAAIQKMALFGSPEEQRTVATARLQGNRMGETDAVRDISLLNAVEFSDKYGSEAEQARAGFAGAVAGVQRLKAAERGTEDVVKDSVIDAALMAANTVGGIATLGALGIDSALGTTMSPDIAEGMDWLGNKAHAAQSQLMQDRREQHAIEAELDRQDRQARYEERRAAQDKDEAQTLFEALAPWAQKQGEAFVETIGNYADDPIMAGSLIPEGIGSMAPTTLLIKTLGKAGAVARLVQSGMSDEAAQLAVATAMVGATEVGAAVSQTQQDVMSLPLSELEQSPEYRAMRDLGMSEDDIRQQLAVDAGQTSAVSSTPGALLAGRVAAPFAANPLSTGGRGIAGAARNMTSETVEEGLQEANSQISANLGVRGIGVERAIDEGVAEAAAQGAIGGMAMSGPMQAPSAARDLVVDAASGATNLTKQAVQGVQSKRAAAEDAASPVGTPAREKAAETVNTAASEIVSALREEPAPVEPNQSEAEQTEATPAVDRAAVADAIENALLVSEEDSAFYAESYPLVAQKLQETGAKRATRSTVLEAVGGYVLDDTLDTNTRAQMAISLMDGLGEMQQVTADTTVEAVKAAGKEEAMKGLRTELQVIESAPYVKKAREIIETMTPEQVAAIVPADALTSPDVDEPTKQAYTKMLETIGRINPEALDRKTLDLVLNQVGPNYEKARKSLEETKKILEEFDRIDAEKEKIRGIKGFTAKKGITDIIRKSKGQVRDEIRVTGNQNNGMPSLKQHRARILEALHAGREQDAIDMLDDLRSFAVSQANKVAAMNTSAAGGKAERVAYEAYGPFEFFMRDAKDGVFVELKSPNSVALARDVHLDASSAAFLANQLTRTYGLPGDFISVPDLDTRINKAAALPPFKLSFVPDTPAPAADAPAPVEMVADPEIDGMIERLQNRKAATAPVVTEQVTEQVVEGEPEITEQVEAISNEISEVATEQVAAEQVVPEMPVEEILDEVAEDEVTATDEPAEVEEAPVVSWFNELPKRLMRNQDGRNILTDAFKPRKHGSTLVAQEAPVTWLKDNAADLGLPDTPRDALIRVLDETYSDFEQRMADAAEAMLTKKKWDTDEKIAKGMRFGRETLPLNLMVKDEAGNRFIEPRVMAAAFMATYEWMLANSKPQRKMDDEKINKMFGRPRDAAVTAEMRQAQLFGMSLQATQEQLAQKMMQLLDIAPKTDEAIRETQGIFRSLAANALEIWMDEHEEVIGSKDAKGNTRTRRVNKVTTPRLIEWQTVGYDVKGDDGKMSRRDMIVLRPMADFGVDADNAALAKMREPFTRLFTGGRVKPRHIGKPPTTVATTQMGNKLAELSSDERRVLKRVQETPNYLVMPGVNLVRAMGEERYRRLLGFTEIKTGDKYHPDHLASIEGKNQTISHDLAEVMDYVAEVEETGEDPAGVPIFFEYGVSSVGRLQQHGQVTPQGSKIARELIAATQATLDLDDPVQEDFLWLAIAQSIGVKVEQKSLKDALDEARAAFGNELMQATILMGRFLRDGEMDYDAFHEAVHGSGREVSPKLIHAIMVAAQAVAASPEERKAFKTALALEADGKTDGPVNAMIHMGTGAFTAGEIERFAKGGFFFTDQELSLAGYINAEKTADPNNGGKDLYHMAAARFKAKLLGSVTGAGLPTLRVLDWLLPGFTFNEFEDGSINLDIERSVPKNPLTVFLYGSGEKGIAGKLARQAADELAQKMTRVARGELELTEDQKADLLEVLFKGDTAAQNRFLSNPTGWQAAISSQMLEDMTARILKDFANPMLEAIDEVTGGLRDNMKMTQAASNVQALVFQELFRKRIDARIKEKAGKDERNLSEDEIRDIFVEVMEIAPIYGTDKQSFHISAPTKTPLESVTVGESFTGRLPSRASYIEPADASVKVSPYLTIGTGDGRMILNIYLNGDGSLDTSLPVFDGVEMAVDQVVPASRQINEQVFNGWMDGNPYKAIAEGYDQLIMRLSDEEFQNLSRDTQSAIRQALAKPLLMREGEALEYRHLLQMRANLHSMSRDAEARKTAMKRLASSTDHMASAQAPYLHAGEVVPGGPLAFTEIAAKLEEYRKEALAELEARDKVRLDRETVVQEPTAGFKTRLEKIGEAVPGHEGVWKVSGKAVLGLVQDSTGASKDQQQIMTDMTRLKAVPEDAVFYFGTGRALEGARDALHPDLPKERIQMGQTFSRSRVTFIANLAPETLVHELLHGYTARTLQDHYDDPRATPSHVRHAIGELESLVDAVMRLEDTGPTDLTIEDVNDDLIDTGDTGQGPAPTEYGREITPLKHLQNELFKARGNPMVQVAELISYALSNQGLIEQTKEAKYFGALKTMIRKAIRAIRSMLGLKVHPGDTIWSNIRFNAQMLVAEPKEATVQEEKDTETDQVLAQTWPGDSRLDNLEAMAVQQMNAMVRTIPDPKERGIREAEMAVLVRQGEVAAESANAAGFALNPREATVFQALHAMVSTGLKADRPVQRHIYEALNHVLETLTVEDFFKAWGVEDNPSQNNLSRARAMLTHLTQARGFTKGADGRSDMLATFLALSQVSPDMRKVLAGMKPPKSVELKWDSVDDWLRSLAHSMVNLITRLSLKPRRMADTLGREMDLLTQTLGEVQAKRRSIAALELVGKYTDMANQTLSDKLDQASTAATRYLRQRAEASNGSVKKALTIASYVASVGAGRDRTDNSPDGEAILAGDSLTTMMNHAEGYQMLRSALSDMRGMTSSNAPLMRLINPVKAGIDKLRQEFRDQVPSELARAFKKAPTREEWSRLWTGLGKTDVLALGLDDALELAGDPSRLSSQIKEAEDALNKIAPNEASVYRDKARALAIYMVRQEVTSLNLLKNAWAIAHLFNEPGRKNPGDADPLAVNAIDRLTSLYAFEELDPAVKKTLADLTGREIEGMRTVAGFLANTRALELARVKHGGKTNLVAQNNGWKGYIPSVVEEGASLIVADDAEDGYWIRRGYVRVGTYHGDAAEGYVGKRSYYQSTVGGKPSFRQGVAQTVHETYQGVDARNGRSRGQGFVSGVVLGKKAQRIAKATYNAPAGTVDGLKPNQHLIPILNEKGQVMAYERPMDPKMVAALPVDTHMGRMLGNWAGRILEESAAEEANSTLARTMKEIWDARGDTEDQFINVAESDDPVIRDAWDTLGWRIKAEIEELFGEKTFMVRKDMVDDAIGYRAATTTDAWSGVSRFSKENQERIMAFAEGLMGTKAFSILRRAENNLNDLVSLAKTTIIVRSVVVGVGNIVSNFLHLSLYGINPIDMAQKTQSKFGEITEYVRNRETIQRLQVELASVRGDRARSARLEARLQALEEANARLSIAPLLKAGEFSTVSENLTEADVAIREGRWADFMEKATDRIPGWGKTAAKNALITKDTALFQGLNRMVQYGDFVAKAVLYDHLTQRKGMTERQALDRIFDEFVPYNRLPGRGRDFLESTGLLWFWSYKLRIVKVLGNVLRERPLAAMMMMGGVGPHLGVDTVGSSSLPGTIADGSVWFSVGPQMGFNAPSLHPVVAMAT